MSYLRVNTDVMRNGAGSIRGSGEKIAQTANKISSLSSQVPDSYDGQLRDQILPILSSAVGEGTRLQGEAGRFSGNLTSLAGEIDTVMQLNAGIISEVAVPTTQSSLMKFFARVGVGGIAVVIWNWLHPERYTPTTRIDGTSPPPAVPSDPVVERFKPNSPVKYKYDVSADYPKYGDGKLHPGIDIRPPTGVTGAIPINPIGPGKVCKVGYDEDGYGNYIVVEHTLPNGEKVYSLYAHLAEKPTWKAGDKVSADDVLGNMGSTGRSTGKHLHLQIMKEDHVSTDFSKFDPNGKVNPSDPNSITWEQKMKQEVYSPHDVLNGTGEAQGWSFQEPV